MNNTKKTILGAVIAVVTFGFSAFTTVNKRAIVRYYKTDMTYPISSDPRGYVYFSGDRCELSGPLCSAAWDLGSNPSPTLDNTPLILGSGVSFVPDSEMEGHFE